VSVPGPPGLLWGLSLPLWAGTAVAVGELVRGASARWVSLWRNPETVERLLFDLYLGGAALYLLAALEVGAFRAWVILGLPVVAAGLLLVRVLLLRRAGAAEGAGEALGRGLTDRWAMIALASSLGLFVVELAAALPVATGNTYDSSLLTTYVALLLQHGSVPLSFRPYATPAILYPQGTTVWLAWAQIDFGLPPARTSLLVTPLFQALTPLSGYVLGRRLLGSSKAGAAFALGLAWLGPSTRALVGGSNDFVVALPLVLLLAAQAPAFASKTLPRFADALAFGLLLGYSAAVNVVGTEVLLPALIVLGAIASPPFAGRAFAWFGRWATTFVAALGGGAPSLYVLAAARTSPSTLAGQLSVPSGVPAGIGASQFLGSIDPFLFRAGDIELSPIPIVRVELAGLLVLAVALLLWVPRGTASGSTWTGFSRWAVAVGCGAVLWLGLQVLAGLPASPIQPLAFVSSAAESSTTLFTVYGLLAVVPLALALERLGTTASVGASAAQPPPRRGSRENISEAFLPVAFAVVVVVPAVVLTPVSLGQVLSTTYADFGNVSAADFGLLDYAAGHLSAGSRVLVAPGSAAEFLPGYAPGIVLLYPMVPGWSRINASYSTVVQELTNGTLDTSGRSALAALEVDFVVVTGNNTVLWGAFWASPLRSAEVNSTPLFPVVFHQGDAWIFNASGCRAGSPGCP